MNRIDFGKSLAPHTANIIESISTLECIKPYLLVGGTALSLQLSTRQSEDLDFMSWRKSRNEMREVDWPLIKKELESVCEVERTEILDIDHVEFVVNGVKISFYANPDYSPVKEEVPFLNNLRLADLNSIGAMKMDVLMRRSKFRDYYDIYTLLEAGCNLKVRRMMSEKFGNVGYLDYLSIFDTFVTLHNEAQHLRCCAYVAITSMRLRFNFS